LFAVEGRESLEFVTIRYDSLTFVNFAMGMRLASAAADSAELSVLPDRRQQAPAKEGQLLIKKLQEQRDKSIAVRGVFDDRKSGLPRSALGLNILGTTDDLIRVARRAPVEEAIVALPLRAEERLKSLFWKSEGIAAVMQDPSAETTELRKGTVESLAPGINRIPSLVERKSNRTLRWRSLPFTTLCVAWRHCGGYVYKCPTKVHL
jgi:hypothetical protein